MVALQGGVGFQHRRLRLAGSCVVPSSSKLSEVSWDASGHPKQKADESSTNVWDFATI